MTVRKLIVAMAGVSALLWSGPPAPSTQEMTERYIPVGRSPGLSGTYTIIGKIQTVDARNRTVVIAGPTGTWSARVTERTKIWLDRTALRQMNLKGAFSDLRPGLTIEVKPEAHRPAAPGGPAGWIKVQVVASP